MRKKEYYYFVSFAQTQKKKEQWGISHRVLNSPFKPTIRELQKSLEELNPEFDSIAIINFKLLNDKEIRIQ